MGIVLGNKIFLSICRLLVCAGLTLGAIAQTVESIPFRALLTPRNVVPAVALQASGVATVWLRIVRDATGTVASASLDVSVSYQFPGSVTVTGLKFYRGVTGTAGELALDTGFTPTTDPGGRAGLHQRLAIPQGQLGILMVNPRSIYVSVETAAFPGGALRGQLESPDQAVLLTRLESTSSPLTATGAIQLLATRDLRGRLTSAQLTFHITPPKYPTSSVRLRWGNNTLDLALLPAPFADRKELPINQVNADLVTALLRSPAQVSLAMTTQEPADTLSGQLHGTDRLDFFPQKPLFEALRLSLHTLRDQSGRVVVAHAILDPPPGKGLSGATITGKGGQIVFGSAFAQSYPFTSLNISEPEPLAALQELLQTPQDFAVDGTARLAPATGQPVAQSVISAVWDPQHRAIAPGGLFTVFGRNLTSVGGDLAGLLGNRIPTSLNGTSVLMAGRLVPILDVRADHVIAQVPADMPAGSQPVVVRTPTGDSAAIPAVVVATAPAVFFSSSTPEGHVAAIHKANGTEVSKENPARPNDVLLFFSTGFGPRTTPAMVAGITAPESPLMRTPNPTVLIGGRPAVVLYSVMAPGLVGIVQTAVRMPQSAGTGNIPLAVSLGTVRANPVILFAALR